MAAPVRSTPRLQVGDAEAVIDAGWALGQEISASYYRVNYGVMPDGRFLMVRNGPEGMPTRINVVFNWFEELNRLAPGKR